MALLAGLPQLLPSLHLVANTVPPVAGVPSGSVLSERKTGNRGKGLCSVPP